MFRYTWSNEEPAGLSSKTFLSIIRSSAFLNRCSNSCLRCFADFFKLETWLPNPQALTFAWWRILRSPKTYWQIKATLKSKRDTAYQNYLICLQASGSENYQLGVEENGILVRKEWAVGLSFARERTRLWTWKESWMCRGYERIMIRRV